MRSAFYCLLTLTLVLTACQSATTADKSSSVKKMADDTYAADKAFLGQHTAVVELTSGNAKVIIVPKYQARVMTSTCQGDSGQSFGWINYALIDSGKYTPHINAFGGEDRFWMGPEGGQFALYFKKNDPFDLAHWQTPAVLDTVTYTMTSRSAKSASFEKSFSIQNYADTRFNVTVGRQITLLDKKEVEQLLTISIPSVDCVGYLSANSIYNNGDQWKKNKGVLSIWLLSMMRASDETTVMIPYKNGGAKQVVDNYFGKVPAERLIKTDSVLYFKADAQFRSKIGIPPAIVKTLIGSYDNLHNVLTVIKVDYKGDASYVNSAWEIQKEPYKGDVINAYNDGPNNLGSRLGSFYEMETSSPALEVPSRGKLEHKKYIFHFAGKKEDLNKISTRLLGVDLFKLTK